MWSVIAPLLTRAKVRERTGRIVERGVWRARIEHADGRTKTCSHNHYGTLAARACAEKKARALNREATTGLRSIDGGRAPTGPARPSSAALGIVDEPEPTA